MVSFKQVLKRKKEGLLFGGLFGVSIFYASTRVGDGLASVFSVAEASPSIAQNFLGLSPNISVFVGFVILGMFLGFILDGE